MILALIGLWSLCSIYITYLLLKRNMKVAAAACSILYAFILLWAFAIFVVDAMHFGLNTVVNSHDIICGGNMYDSFSYLSEAIYGIPTAFSTAVLYALVTLIGSVVAVLFMSGYRAAKDIYRLLKHRKKYTTHSVSTTIKRSVISHFVSVDILKLYCRANC